MNLLFDENLVWLRTGNISVQETSAILRTQYIVIRHFSEDAIASFLALK
jgi:predicted nuclease of predicted toxin-antitoxin system